MNLCCVRKIHRKSFMEINAFIVLHQLFVLSLNGITYCTIPFNGKVVIDDTDHIKNINTTFERMIS